jgi:hypothetical protein
MNKLAFGFALLAVSTVANFANAQDMSAPATYGEISLTSGFTPDPYSVSLTAGGSIDASTVNASCVGKIANAPDFQLTYTAGSFPLIISVASESDTTLVINGSDGSWYCVDDVDGFNPKVVFPTPGSGVYDIWVGTYGDSLAPATLNISEIQ